MYDTLKNNDISDEEFNQLLALLYIGHADSCLAEQKCDDAAFWLDCAQDAINRAKK